MDFREATLAYLEEAEAHDRTGDIDALFAKIKRIRPLDPPAEVLEVGIGTGWLMAALAERGYRCTGLEVNPWSCEHALKTLRERGIEADIVEGNIESAQFPENTFEVVFAETVLEHVRDYQAALHNIWRSMKAGGVLHISTTNKFSMKSGEYPRVPLYGWLPQRLRLAIRRRAGEEMFFDWNEFTYWGLRRTCKRVGFTEVYDRLELIGREDKAGWKRRIIETYERFPPLRQALLLFDFGVGLYCVK